MKLMEIGTCTKKWVMYNKINQKGAHVSDKILIYFEDYHNAGMDKVVEATEQEWGQLIAPTVPRNLPIDGATVDSEMFDQLYDRPAIDVKLSELQEIEYVVPIV